jgi:hypothetical protein
VVDHRLDLAGVKDTILVAPDQVVDGDGGGDLVTEHGIQFQHLGAGKRLIHQVGLEDLFSGCLSHVQLPRSKQLVSHAYMNPCAGKSSMW